MAYFYIERRDLEPTACRNGGRISKKTFDEARWACQRIKVLPEGGHTAPLVSTIEAAAVVAEVARLIKAGKVKL